MSVCAPLLAVEKLVVSDPDGFPLLDEVGFQLAAAGRLGIAGGESVTNTALALTVLGLHTYGGSLVFAGTELHELGRRGRRRLRGGEVGLWSGDPRLALDPLVSIVRQVADAVLAHGQMTQAAARDEAIDLLEAVGIAHPHRRLHDGPATLTPTEYCRAQLALALAGRPRLLVADDPVRSLVEPERSACIAELDALQHRHRFALLALATEIEIPAALARTVAILDQGRIVEVARRED